MARFRVNPRRLAYCFECRVQTIQWLREVAYYSPGSYRGTRLSHVYVCSDCGTENHTT